MGQELVGREAELYKRCDEVLHYIWDPIGVAGSASARDEYYSYLPHLFALVRDGEDAKEIANYLIETQMQRMGLRANKERALEVAEILLEWREWIWENDRPVILN